MEGVLSVGDYDGTLTQVSMTAAAAIIQGNLADTAGHPAVDLSYHLGLRKAAAQSSTLSCLLDGHTYTWSSMCCSVLATAPAGLISHLLKPLSSTADVIAG